MFKIEIKKPRFLYRGGGSYEKIIFLNSDMRQISLGLAFCRSRRKLSRKKKPARFGKWLSICRCLARA